MKGLIFCVFSIMMLTPAQGEEGEEHLEQFMKSDGFLGCYRCDLGFWDTCYTTETNCDIGELCYTGRGKAAHTLDVKTLGCVKAEECEVETKMELLPNKTIFVMTKHCCDTPFCNSTHKLSGSTLLYLSVAVLTIWHLTEASTGSQ